MNQQKGGYRPNSGRYPKGSKIKPDTAAIRIQKPTTEEAELIKKLSPVERLAILINAAKQKI
jgi:hypothetical protein